MKNKIFKTNKLPFIELRYIPEITSCDKKHQHDELTLTVIKTGNINIIFNDKNDLLKPNEISIVNPKEVHCATLSNIKSLDCYVLYLSSDWCKNIQKSLFNNINFLNINNNLIQNKTFYNDFINLCDELLIEHIPIIEKEEKLINFTSKLFLKYCNKIQYINKNIKNSNLAKEIEKYLIENIENNILLEDISNYMNLSIVHILRIFKKEFGLPIHSFILNKKVHLAKKLLSQNIPIVDVALQSGFFDQSHLNKSFKRVFQLTPKEYQNNIFS